MDWPIDVHKYPSEITRRALFILAEDHITTSSTAQQIQTAERKIAAAGLYKNADSAKDTIRTRLLTYFKSYHCIDNDCKLTEAGRAFAYGDMTLQEFAFWYIANYGLDTPKGKLYPLHLLLLFLKKAQSIGNEHSYLSEARMGQIANLGCADEVTDDFVGALIREKTENAKSRGKQRFDTWMTILNLSGMLYKGADKLLRIANQRLCDLLLQAYDKGITVSEGKIITGVLEHFPAPIRNAFNKSSFSIESSLNGSVVEGCFRPTLDESKRVSCGANVLLYGVPGAGKSYTIEHEYCADEDCIERLVFHPDYTYSDFVGQIMPTIVNDKVHYKFMPGPFTKLLKKAYETPEKSFYLIIEEINRGNAPAIFGEIFQLLDRLPESQRGYAAGTSEYAITQPAIANEVYGDETLKVRIPANMSILGTMNTSDQNVFTLDTAFQRRWIMRMIPNSFDNHPYAGRKILDTGVSWKKFCEVMNEEILKRNNVTSSEDKRLGAYFISADDLQHLPDELVADERERVRIKHHNRHFAEKVLKYLWDDAFRFVHEQTFNTKDYKSLEMVIDAFATAIGSGRFHIFSESLRQRLIEEKPQVIDGVAVEEL